MKLLRFKRKPLYSLKEVNEYIKNYQDIVEGSHRPDPNMLEVMRLVIEHMNQRLLKEGK